MEIGDIGVINKTITILTKAPIANLVYNEGAYGNVSTELGKYEQLISGKMVVLKKIIGGSFDELELALWSDRSKVFRLESKYITFIDYCTDGGAIREKSDGCKETKFESLW